MADSFYSSTKLLLHADGANGSTILTDSSPSSRSASSIGASYLSTAQAKFNASSLYFPQSNPVQYASHSDWNLNITAWTWELWYYELSGSLGSLICRRTSGGAQGWVLTTNNVRALINGAGFEGQQTWSGGALNTWNHLAWVKNGTTLYVFLNGVLVHTKTGVNTLLDTTNYLIFGQGDSTSENRFKGYMDDIRWTPNVARYTASFIAPIAPFSNSAYGISGITLDDKGLPCSRLVRVYLRADGSYVNYQQSNVSTGKYDITTQGNGDHFVLVLDDSAGENYNTIIHDHVIPT